MLLKGVRTQVSWEYINGYHEVRRNEAFEWWKLPPGERSFTATSYEGAPPPLPRHAPRKQCNSKGRSMGM